MLRYDFRGRRTPRRPMCKGCGVKPNTLDITSESVTVVDPDGTVRHEVRESHTYWCARCEPAL